MENLARLHWESLTGVVSILSLHLLQSISSPWKSTKDNGGYEPSRDKEQKCRIETRDLDKDDIRFNLNDEKLHRSVETALAIAKKDGLISYNDLPLPWRTNRFILHGYRFTSSTVSVLLSPLRLSNESANIWTHLIPALLILSYPMYNTPLFTTYYGPRGYVDVAVASIYFAAAAGSLLCSTAWHVAKSSSKPRIMSAFVSVDIMSVSLVLSAFAVMTEYLAFYQQPHLQQLYVGISIVWCVTGLILPWTSLFRHVDLVPIKVRLPFWKLSNGWTHVLFFVALGVQGIIVPMLHSAWISGWPQTTELYGATLGATVPVTLGALIYPTKFPECVWPGKFDYCGCSHNIWHVATALAAVNGCRVMKGMFEIAWSRVV